MNTANRIRILFYLIFSINYFKNLIVNAFKNVNTYKHFVGFDWFSKSIVVNIQFPLNKFFKKNKETSFCFTQCC